jgi:hypothetical protein
VKDTEILAYRGEFGSITASSPYDDDACALSARNFSRRVYVFFPSNTKTAKGAVSRRHRVRGGRTGSAHPHRVRSEAPYRDAFHRAYRRNDTATLDIAMLRQPGVNPRLSGRLERSRR